MSSSGLQSPVRSRQRRTSSVGRIDVGDTSIPALSTMNTAKSSKRASDQRITQLNTETSGSNGALLNKLFIAWRELTYRNTWINPLIILVVVYTSFFTSGNQTESNYLYKFVNVSYKIPNTSPQMYDKGAKDFAFVGFYMIFFTFFREFLMQVFLRPIAVFAGIKKERKIKRFMEQTYSLIYYGISGPLGLYIMRQTPLWFFDTTQFYVNYPHKSHEWLFKLYYLGQAAFWAQQSVVLILQLEAPRKDFKELVLHHIITIALIYLSYAFHFTWMGLAVYITMDVSDFFLATSKTLNYLNSRITGPFFIVFVGVWIYLRHYLNLKILWSILTEFKTVGDYTLNWDTQQYKCWISQPIVFFLIFALQLVNSYWLFLIFRILWRYLLTDNTVDERSDSEEEEQEDKSKEKASIKSTEASKDDKKQE